MKASMMEIGTTRVRVWEGGTGPVLLYLHGFEQHPGAAPFLRRLAAGRRVVAPEHPGFGESDPAEHSIHDVVDLALHYRRVIESVAGSPVDVVGHCLGGMIAAETAALSPHLVRRLVLVCPYGLWLDADPLPDPFALAPAALAAAKWHRPDVVGEPVAEMPPDRAEAAILRSQNLGAATRWLWPLPDRGLRRRIEHIEAPTLVLHGASDGLIPLTYAKEFVRLLRTADLETVPAAGHLPMVEAPDAFHTAVSRFLS